MEKFKEILIFIKYFIAPFKQLIISLLIIIGVISILIISMIILGNKYKSIEKIEPVASEIIHSSE